MKYVLIAAIIYIGICIYPTFRQSAILLYADLVKHNIIGK